MFLFQDEDRNYLFFPKVGVGYEGVDQIFEEAGRYDFEFSVVYVGDEATEIELEDYGECDIAIVPVGNGLAVLDCVLKISRPKIVLLRNYRTEECPVKKLSSLSEHLSDLSDRGLIKFTMNPSHINYPKYREFWLFCVDGDTEESVLRGQRNYEF